MTEKLLSMKWVAAVVATKAKALDATKAKVLAAIKAKVATRVKAMNATKKAVNVLTNTKR